MGQRVLGPTPMLVGLHIRNVVLIDRLELSFEGGLNVLTGETGAGKSILLDALGLALGVRADTSLIRPGAEQASVAAFFLSEPDHPSRALLRAHDIESESEEVIARRVVTANGASRAYINDQPVSVGLLRDLGRTLVEIQGQHDQQLLMESGSHRRLLDEFAGHGSRLAALGEAYAAYRDLLKELAAFRESHQQAVAEETYLQHVVEELETLNPTPAEEADLAATRALLVNGEKIAAALSDAATNLAGDSGAEMALRAAQRALDRIPDELRGNFGDAIAALDRAVIESSEAAAEIDQQLGKLELDGKRLGEVEERLFKLRDLARKHNVGVDQLADVLDSLAEKLNQLESGGEKIAALEASVSKAQSSYGGIAADVSKRRRKASAKLDKAVMNELAPLKLGSAVFRTEISQLEDKDWSTTGVDRVTFQVSTVPGADPGPLPRVASGGELSRLLLALKVVLTGTEGPSTLIFDEVDRGLGGATADAVGARLGRLAQQTQVLVVTHSPQVAARAAHHWRVLKGTDAADPANDDSVHTQVEHLDPEARREEVARMLAGAEITNEARAAAESLINGQQGTGIAS